MRAMDNTSDPNPTADQRPRSGQTADQTDDSTLQSQDKSSSQVSQSSPSTSWWSSIVQKSSHTFESIKRDLNEFKETVQNESSIVVSNTASYVSQTMKDTITGISQTIAPEYELKDDTSETQQTGSPPTNETNVGVEDKDKEEVEEHESVDWSDIKSKAKNTFSEVISSIADAFLMNRNYYEDDDQMYVFSGDKLVAIDRWQQLLTEVQTDADTYRREPSGPPEHYESWLMTFNLIDYQRQMDHLLKTVPQMQEFYSQLVPNWLSDVEFWHRYFYRVHQLRETERKKIEDKDSQAKTESQEWDVADRLNKSVQIKLLNESNGSAKKSQKDLVPNATETSDLQSLNSSPDSNKSETGSDDWEKAEAVVSDEDIKDWVNCE